MSKPTLHILAAGMGSRYGGLKQVDPMGPHGETVLDYSVFDAKRAGFGKVVFVIRKDFEDEFKTKVGARFDKQIPVEYGFQAKNSAACAVHRAGGPRETLGHLACRARGREPDP